MTIVIFVMDFFNFCRDIFSKIRCFPNSPHFRFEIKTTQKLRSVVSCGSFLRGLCLSMKWEELKQSGLTGKALNNKFTNYGRNDRLAGKQAPLRILTQKKSTH